MRTFKIKKIPNCEYSYLSLSTDYSRLEEYLTDIEKYLSNKNYKGMVLFDLLLSNGMSNERFQKAFFDGKKFVLNSIKTIKNVDKEIKKICLEFYNKNQNFLENSILTKSQKFIIRKNILN